MKNFWQFLMQRGRRKWAIQGDLKKRVLRKIAITSKIIKLEQRNLRHFVAKSST